MKLLLGTIPMLLYVHLVLRMLYFSVRWDSLGGLLVSVTFMGFGVFVPVLLIYPGYLERFTGKRNIFLILLIPMISLIWAVANGMMFSDVRSLFGTPLIVESGILFFISFSLLYSYIFQLYEKVGFFDWLKTKERFFYNDPPEHIRDFDKTASIYIGTMLVIVMLSVYVAVDGYLERRWWKNRQSSTPVQETCMLALSSSQSSTGCNFDNLKRHTL